MQLMNRLSLLLFAILLLLTGCEANRVIVNDVDEREANEIIVFLASRGIASDKLASSGGTGVGAEAAKLWSIAVEPSKTVEAMALLNQVGLPRQMGTDLLTLFAKQGFMSSEKEDTIRYQAGLGQQIANMIKKIDGVIEADVQLSFPVETGVTVPGMANAPVQRVTAAVYVKHQGVLDDPNSHLITKIKRLVSGSVTGLDINDVTVISDRSRFTDITLSEIKESITAQPKDYVSIWSIVISARSAGTFRLIFFSFSLLLVIFALIVGWLLWKIYPILKARGWKELLQLAPIHPEPKMPSSDEEGV
jgi:type III secretion protein J